MSIYSKNESGTRAFRSRFNLSHRKLFDLRYGEIVPAFAKFILPGDVWKIGANTLIRYQPMLSPTLTRSWARMRYFFVPLRLVEEHIEEVITGSKNGKLINTQLPVCKDVFGNVNDSDYHVYKWSILDYFGLPVGDYKNTHKNASMMAQYWLKAYYRCIFDYYIDENLTHNSDNFDTFCSKFLDSGKHMYPQFARLHKDYFTSSLPWQLKGITPTFDFPGAHADFFDAVGNGTYEGSIGVTPNNTIGNDTDYHISNKVLAALNKNTIEGVSFDMDDIRALAAQTRVFERLARCGSRYTEYLHSNFGTAPADGTLQRAQYLGGWTQPIVTTEVVQTGGSTDGSVGTLRGHGISNAGNKIRPFVAKEFGVILGLMDVMPELQYTQGIDREFTYKSRFDFFNPSFQHLAEQEVRNGELYFSTDGKNDDTFGFQAIYNELRSSRDMVVGDMRDTLSYWNQAITFSQRPNLNDSFIDSESYLSSFNKPFNVNGTNARPIIVDLYNLCDVYRPMVRYGTPGLIDHL